MKLRKSLMTASLGTALAIGAMGQAQASVYGSAGIKVANLVISTTGVVDPAQPLTYQFDLQNTAVLNGTGDFTFNTCSGTFLGATSCNTGAGPVLNAGPAQVGTNQADNTFSYLGPGNNEYARSDSVIDDAQLVNFQSTDVTNIAEAELQSGEGASASSSIQSGTSLNFQFTAVSPGTISLDFMADVDLLAEISDIIADSAIAQAQTTFQFKLVEDATGASIVWNPTTAKAIGACGSDALQTGVGVTCLQDEIAENLNNNVGVSTVPVSSDNYSRDNAMLGDDLRDYFVEFQFVNSGTYTLTLSETKNVLLTREVSVPEPATLLLLGTGLIGMGVTRRRLRKA